jgi:antitoxin (DNA-binding transcriptional repressor) of toxin-antitoxin stability system
MKKTVTLADAKAHLSALITEAEEGAEITITRRGRPVARSFGAPRTIARRRVIGAGRAPTKCPSSRR